MDVNFVCAFFAMALKMWLISMPNGKRKLSESLAGVFTQNQQTKSSGLYSKKQDSVTVYSVLGVHG